MLNLPIETASQEALWLSWPVADHLWSGQVEPIRHRWAELALLASRYQKVRINCGQGPRRDQARRLIEEGAQRDERSNLDRIEFLDIPTDDVWVRDHGPLFCIRREGLDLGPEGRVIDAGRNGHLPSQANAPGGREGAASREASLVAIDFPFNAWGGKFPPWDRDDEVPARISESLGIERLRGDLICEGGALESNGEGMLLTTESVLLNPNRNPGWSPRAVEMEFRRLLGVNEIVWLERGLAHDDTDGHIDTLARFFAPDGIVHCVERSEGPRRNALVLDANRERLQGLRTRAGGRFDLAPLPLPEPVPGPEGWREAWLPATYANYVALNGALLVPTYRQAGPDDHALGLFRELFPGREVIPFDCLDILQEGGALHCLTLNQPSVGNGLDPSGSPPASNA